MTFTSHCSCVCAMLSLIACSDSGTGELARMGARTSDAGGATTSAGTGATGAPPIDAPLPPGNPANGLALVDKNACSLCHYTDYGGV